VLVPGTGSYDYLGVTIDPLTDPVPAVNVREIKKVADDGVVFEQAIAAAHRAGIPDEQLVDGTISFGIWGVDFKGAHSSFIYESFEGLRIPVNILGGASRCAHGTVLDNLLNYNKDNADADANDLYAKVQAWLPAHPSRTGAPRNVIVASHSWGGADAEYLAQELPTIEGARGPLADAGGTAKMAFTIAMGVPGFVLGYTFKGPGLRDLTEGSLYEVDRPDDPVHALHPGQNGGGHQYDITFGDDYRGSYGITTEDMSCDGVPGPCTN
jgi:pimeloyl-ACP methyl ester carboxylesterase